MDSYLSLASFTCRDTLVMILRKLGARDLARASCVCRMWRDMASDDAIVRPAFMEPWKLKEILGEPVSGSFWRENGIWKFAISHKIARGDSVTSLAKKYYVQVINKVECFLVTGFLVICSFLFVDLGGRKWFLVCGNLAKKYSVQKFLTMHSRENRVFILYFGFIHNEHKVNKRSTNHTSPKEQKHETLTCLNCKYTIQILHVTQGSRGHIIQRT